MRKRINGEIYDLSPSMTEDEADFSSTSLMSDVNLSESEFGYCNFDSTEFSRVNFSDCSFYRCEMQNAIFDDCDLTQASFEGSDLTGASFISCVLDSVDFKGANLQSVEFRNCTFSGFVDFFNCDLIDTFFSDLDYAKENSRNLVIPNVSGEQAFGAMTGPLLKLNKVKLPMRA